MSRKRAKQRMVRFCGGPVDGLTVPWVEGYFSEGDVEVVDGRHRTDGTVIPAAAYVMRDGDLHHVPNVPAHLLATPPWPEEGREQP